MRSTGTRLSLLVIVLMLFVGGCDDNTFNLDPLLASDTVEVAAPIAGNEDLPVALDLRSQIGMIGGGRFPETIDHAGIWDFLVRIEGGQLVLVPGGRFGLAGGARITRPLSETFEGLREAPGVSTMIADSAVAVSVGDVFAARTRDLTGCAQFSKLQPLEVDQERGRLTVRVVTNERCGDPRLVER